MEREPDELQRLVDGEQGPALAGLLVQQMGSVATDEDSGLHTHMNGTVEELEGEQGVTTT